MKERGAKKTKKTKKTLTTMTTMTTMTGGRGKEEEDKEEEEEWVEGAGVSVDAGTQEKFYGNINLYQGTRTGREDMA